MNRKLAGLAVMVVGGAGMAAFLTQSTRVSKAQIASAPVRPSAEAPAPTPLQKVQVDLTEANQGTEIAVKSAPWVTGRVSVLRHPRRTYIVEITAPRYAPNRYRLPPVALANATAGKDCAPEIVAAFAALESNEMEAEVPTLFSQARERLSSFRCARGEFTLSSLLRSLEEALVPPNIVPGQRSGVTLEEYDTKGVKTRQWSWTFLGHVESVAGAASEEEWIVKTIATTMSGFVDAARKKTAVPVDVAREGTGFRVTVGEQTWPVELDSGISIWNPSNYRTMAGDLLRNLPPDGKGGPESDIAGSLLTPTNAVLERLSAAVSKSLLATPGQGGCMKRRHWSSARSRPEMASTSCWNNANRSPA